MLDRLKPALTIVRRAHLNALERTRRSLSSPAVSRAAWASGLAALLIVLLAACAAVRAPTGQPAPSSLPVTPPPSLAPSPTATGPITITLWEEDADDADVLLDELSATFMRASPDVVVRRIHYSYNDLRDEFRAAAFRGQLPEIVVAPGEFAGPFGELEIVQPVQAIFAPDFLDQYLFGSLAGATSRGRIWGLPDNYGSHLMLLFNKALVSDVPANTDAWISQLKSFTDPAQGQYGLVYSQNEAYWLVPWIGGFGGWPLDSADRPALDTVEVAEALQFVQDLVRVDRVMPEKVDYDTAFDLFRQGKAAYVIDGAWNLERYQGLGIDVGIASLPVVSATGLAPVSMATGRYWFISRGVEGVRLDAAARFVEFMTSAEAQREWLVKMRRLPSSKEVAQSDLIANDPALSAIMAQLRTARGIPPALEMACAWQGMAVPLAGLMAGSLTPQDAAAAMQTEAESCLDDMGSPLSPTPTPTP